VKDEWDLDHILDVFRSELEARERANGNNVSPTDQSSSKISYNRGRTGLPLPTDAALFATGSKPTCTYCRKDRASNACKNVTNITARKETPRVRDKLRLPSERKQTISVKTFGSTEENTQSVDVVQLCISTEHGDDVQLSAFVVPLICDPLQSQSIAHASVTHALLKGLKLADYSTGEDDIMVDILVGSDQYWQLVSGKVLRGEDGSTAIQRRLG